MKGGSIEVDINEVMCSDFRRSGGEHHYMVVGQEVRGLRTPL